MEPNPNETTVETTDAVETTEATPATEEATTSENSPSTEDLSELIEAEKKGKPDPNKARERFLQKRQQTEPEGGDSEEPDDRPLTRAEVEAMLNERTQAVMQEAYGDQINNIAAELADSEQEAELIRTIHANRNFPTGMSIRDQLSEAKAIATYKREQAKSAELARKVQSQQTAARNTASTQRDPQSSPQPNLAADLTASLKRAGYTYNNQEQRYEKKLPNGKLLVKKGNNPPVIIG